MNGITKAVFPVAGLGTRFLPVTKASPKEMLPIVDKPLIQYAVEEAVDSGITHMVFITGRNKRAIEDHFDKAYELETELEERGRHNLLDQVRDVVPKNVSCTYVRQSEALGLGHAVLCARAVVGPEPFAVILADDLIDARVPVLRQMVEQFHKEQRTIVAVQPIPMEESRSYGIIKGEAAGDRMFKMTGIVEKPHPEVAPSNLAVVGRYILTPAVMDILERVIPGAGGEIQLTDAIATVLKSEGAFGYEFEGRRFDCGSKIGYLEANVMYALKHAEVGKDFCEFLSRLESADVVCSAEQTAAAVHRLAGEITHRLAASFPLVLGVMGGGVVFTGQLLPLLHFPLEFDYIHVTRYRGTTQGGTIEWKVEPRRMLEGRVVLVLDDILDEGHTLAAIRERLLQAGVSAFYSAVFADKDLGRDKPIKADFIGVSVPNRYVFGFGMDVEGGWRNLPAIYAVKD